MSLRITTGSSYDILVAGKAPTDLLLKNLKRFRVAAVQAGTETGKRNRHELKRSRRKNSRFSIEEAIAGSFGPRSSGS